LEIVSLFEIVDANTEEIENIKTENDMLKNELCQKDNTYS
jgi:hypothetical protein